MTRNVTKLNADSSLGLTVVDGRIGISQLEQQISIILDGAKQKVKLGSTGFELFADKTVVAMRVSGELRDLAHAVSEGDSVESVGISSQDGLNILRHSTAHVLAQAVQKINPEAKLGIGPPIVDGFYYDFDVTDPFTPEDLKSIEKEMERIIRSGQRFVRQAVTEEEARKELANEPYKLELISIKGSADLAEGSAEVGAGELTIYHNTEAQSGETIWKDLCRGPHLPNTRMIHDVALFHRTARTLDGILARILVAGHPAGNRLALFFSVTCRRVKSPSEPRESSIQAASRPKLV